MGYSFSRAGWIFAILAIYGISEYNGGHILPRMIAWCFTLDWCIKNAASNYTDSAATDAYESSSWVQDPPQQSIRTRTIVPVRVK